jgi:hypothetical protein
MTTLLILFLPVFIVGGLVYLFITLGDSIVTAAVDWVTRRD